jgi:hypothetical protein
MAQLAAWTLRLPKPRAVLMVSAHWEAAPLMLSAPGAGTPLVYDFGGFAPRYYTLTYPTPDATALAAEVAALMPDRAPLHQHPSRGLDHGAWVPLKVMCPLADVPALPLFVTLGASSDPGQPVETVIDGYWMGWPSGRSRSAEARARRRAGTCQRGGSDGCLLVVRKSLVRELLVGKLVVRALFAGNLFAGNLIAGNR